MAKDYLRVLVSYKGTLFSFMNINLSERDGSINITLRRDGFNDFGVTWSNQPGNETPVRNNFATLERKDRKITIHASGRINLPDSKTPIFIEPLAYISQPFSFCSYRIPKITALSVYKKKIDPEDQIINLDELPDSAQSFEFIIGPSSFIHDNALKIEYLNKYAVTIALHPIPLQVPKEYDIYFTTLSTGTGIFPQQVIEEDAALIAFHQALTNTKDLIIYAPNINGEWRIIFSVPMRIAPNATIQPADPNLLVEIIDQTRDPRTNKVQLRFIVRNKHTGEKINKIITFKDFLLDARL